MTTVLDEIVGEIVDAVFDGRRQDDETVRAASRIADMISDPTITREALTRAVADLILAIDYDLADRDITATQAAYRAATPKKPADPRNYCTRPVFQPRKWRVAPHVPTEPVSLDVTAALLGDPQPGRSAWDLRKGVING